MRRCEGGIAEGDALGGGRVGGVGARGLRRAGLISVEQAAEASEDGSFADGCAAAAGGAGENAISETRERQALQPDGTMSLQ